MNWPSDLRRRAFPLSTVRSFIEYPPPTPSPAKVLFVRIVTLPSTARLPDTGWMKRTVQVNVKMTQEDFNLLKRAAEKRWTDAVLTNSGIVLGLAKIAAQQTLGKKTR